MLVRNMTYYTKDIRAKVWNSLSAPQSPRADRLTFALAGFGRMARVVAAKARPFFKEIVAYDPMIDRNAAKAMNVRVLDTLEDLLKEADVLSIHIPLMDATHHMFDEKRLRLMKPTAYLVNTARGGLVDSAALCRALKEGWIRGAATDVLEDEPPSFDDPLFSLENLIVTPHAAWRSDAAGVDIRVFAARTMKTALLEGEATNRVL
jgi:D-3-phosphoglycerate dehydrogenase